MEIENKGDVICHFVSSERVLGELEMLQIIGKSKLYPNVSFEFHDS